MLAENCALSLLSLLGVLFAFRARQEAALPFAMILLVFPLVFYFTHPAGRYRFPIDSVLTILTVYAIAHSLSRLRLRIAALARSAEPAAPTPN
jgi:ACR3 family arsenite efflux pump ArsB